MFKVLIVLVFLASGCEDSGLAGQISKGVIERKALENGQYCYTNKSNHRYCIKHMGLDKTAQNKADLEQTFLGSLEQWWLELQNDSK